MGKNASQIITFLRLFMVIYFYAMKEVEFSATCISDHLF